MDTTARVATFNNRVSFHEQLAGRWVGKDGLGEAVTLTFNHYGQATINYIGEKRTQCAARLHKTLVLPEIGEYGFVTSQFECATIKIDTQYD